MRDALLVERDALGMLARQQRVVGAELLDEAAIARAARIGDDDVEERPLLGAVTGHTNSKHSVSFEISAREAGRRHHASEAAHESLLSEFVDAFQHLEHVGVLL